MFIRLLAALFAFAGATAFAQERPLAEIPYRIDYGGWLTISVSIDGRGPYDFIIDTGATQTLVLKNLQDKERFPPSGGPPQRVLGLLSAGAFPTFSVGEVSVGNEKLSNLVTMVLPDWTVSGASPQGVFSASISCAAPRRFSARARGFCGCMRPERIPATRRAGAARRGGRNADRTISGLRRRMHAVTAPPRFVAKADP